MAKQRQSDRKPSLSELAQSDDFIGRHIGPDADEQQAMLKALGVESLQDLVDQAVPSTIRETERMPLGAPMGEQQALDALRALADQNRQAKSLIGLGFHNTITPPVIQRNVLENPGWYTAYTPYQPEISQGRLEALLNFQQMVIDLTGMELANASLLDEATAAAEAMSMMQRVSKSKSKRFLVDANAHPQTIAVMRTRAEPLGLELVVETPANFPGQEAFGVLVQYPDTTGEVPDHRKLVETLHGEGTLVAVATDLLALCRLQAPGTWGADVVLGNSQRFGVPLGYGGPHAAFFATHDKYKRNVPGRIIGVSVDTDGTPALRMALQTREQHIRRDKATSNICTAQVLLANMAGLYACWHGPNGLWTIAERVHRLTGILAAGLQELGFTRVNTQFFDTLTVEAGDQAQTIVKRALDDHEINLRVLDGGRIGIALDETCTPETVDALLQAFAGEAEIGMQAAKMDGKAVDGLPAALARGIDYLDHANFNAVHTETEMLRYLRRLQSKDIALDRSMIPLGSCTMKLNAAAEMQPVSWPEFAQIHPFAPKDQAVGYHKMADDLADKLAKMTGFHAVTLQPNSGAQGEYAGLLLIRAYHESRGEGHRSVVLIPTSAHGTNPASAKMAGYQVQLVDCDDHGNVDVEDLKAKIDKHRDKLAGLMVTYPSTHGVFESAIKDICARVHDAGGQVYMDGANLNALLGVANPGRFGADVAHMNLHKTFCIPHGGGGPGVGPVGVAEHLTPFLPGHPLDSECGGDQAIGPICATPLGSAGILPISWMYTAMMGAEGLTRATETAILNANYLAHRLSEGYPILYRGENGRVAHECIVDTRVLRDECGISVDDVAKRLIDFGYHAPTMSWPVAGALMVEPTESESKAEIDRFCEALLTIAREAREVEKGTWPQADNPLVNAPHTLAQVTADSWAHAYSRQDAAYPAEHLLHDKYWAPVSRVDNAYGDRHLVCTCPPIEAYREAAE
ncbi:aminomethyl-transferring glycine dehydrogenase [Rhodovibrio salinarum]|uniref:Glycine dehydrogenase (decarboxylating) n=1 Tax=Rhodovibrio salinarum TaxID=1087 RepID=A0A934QHW8_9PROT|nr:aminomethyl-transferring glycine dehydrogenase [Rhodovibrio salinarum]MBK1696810.1 glycine dehydrogenase (aminomethyl-transferring) [Rhodovibrio salinarum]